nr:T9SS type A sorting domain-containing protein [Prolixibacteraceae bacterium]
PQQSLLLPARASSGLPLTAISSDTGIVRVVGQELRVQGAGTAQLTLFQEGNNNFYPSDTVLVTLTVDKGNQQIVAQVPDMQYGKGPYPFSCSANSGLPVSLAITDPSVLEQHADSLYVRGAGTVALVVSQEGNALWKPAGPDTLFIIVRKGIQEMVFSGIEPKRFNDPPFLLDAQVTSGLELSFAVGDTSVAGIQNDWLQIRNVGETTLTAFNDGNELWEAVSLSQALIVEKGDQFIQAEYIDTLIYGCDPVSIQASASSGLPVFVSVADERIARFDPSLLSVLQAGETRIVFSQPGNGQWNPAETLSRELVVTKAQQSLVFSLPDTVPDEHQAYYADARASSGLPVHIASSDEQIVAVESDSIRILSPGEAILTLFQDGGQNFEPVEASWTIVVTRELSVPENGLSPLFVFPNPARHFVRIDPGGSSFSGGAVFLFSALGQCVRAWETDRFPVQLRLTDIPPGIYLLRVKTPATVATRKLVIEK